LSLAFHTASERASERSPLRKPTLLDSTRFVTVAMKMLRWRRASRFRCKLCGVLTVSVLVATLTFYVTCTMDRRRRPVSLLPLKEENVRINGTYIYNVFALIALYVVLIFGCLYFRCVALRGKELDIHGACRIFEKLTKAKSSSLIQLHQSASKRAFLSGVSQINVGSVGLSLVVSTNYEAIVSTKDRNFVSVIREITAGVNDMYFKAIDYS
jgi:hypothetical protein